MKMPLRLSPVVEILESRIAPAVHEWTGLGADNLWSNDANWTNGSPATDGSGDIDLVFHTNLNDPAQLVMQNDIAGLVVDSITFDANAGMNAAGGLSATGYTFNGNAITISTGAAGQDPFGINVAAGVANTTSGITETFNTPITLLTDNATFRIQDFRGRLTFHGDIDLGGRTLTFDNTTGGGGNSSIQGFLIDGIISNGNLVKVGSGTLQLSGNNSFTNFTTNGGYTLATTNTALGATAGIITTNDPGQIELRNGITVEKTTFNLNSNNLGGGLGASGNTTNTFRGNMVLFAGAGGVALGAGISDAETNTRLIIDGVISGATSTLSLNGAGVIEFTKDNTYTGVTNHNGNLGYGALQINTPGGLGAGGALNYIQLNRNGAGPTGSSLWLNFDGTLGSGGIGENIQLSGSGVGGLGAIRVLGNHDVTISGSIAFTFAGAAGPWTIGVDGVDGSLTTTGVIESQGSNRGLTKTGLGSLIIGGSSNNTYVGATVINGGTVSVQNNSASPLGLNTATVTVNNGGTLRIEAGSTVPNPVQLNAGAILAGDGNAGAVTSTGGIVSPGSNPGRLTVSTISLNAASSFLVDINGATPATQHDQLRVTGTVALGGVLTLAGDFAATPGTEIVLIDNVGGSAVNGIFEGLPEGSFVGGGAVPYRISYVGGDGNDVTLVQNTYFVVDGAEGADQWRITRDVSDAKLLHVTRTLNGTLLTPFDVSLADFIGVRFNGGSGDDTVIIDGKNGYFASDFEGADAIVFDGGSGNNILVLDGNAGAPLLNVGSFAPTGSSGGSFVFSGDLRVSFDRVNGVADTFPVANFNYLGKSGAADEIALLPDGSPTAFNVASTGHVPLVMENKSNLNFLGQGGADRFRIATFDAAAAGVTMITVNAVGGSPGELEVLGSSAADVFTFEQVTTTTGTITRVGQPTIAFDGSMETVFDGGAGDDTLHIVKGSTLGLSFTGGAGSDTLSFATSSAAVGFNADRLGTAQTLNGLGWALTLGDVVENFVGSLAADQITIAPGTTSRGVSDPNGTGTLIVDGLGSALRVNGPLLNNASGSVTLTGLLAPTFFYDNIGVVQLIRVPPPPAFGTTGNTFAAPLDFDAGKGAASIATGDLNGDGLADFVTADAKGGTISIALSTSVGLLLPAVQKLSGGMKPTGIVVGNFDGLNGLDIAVTNAGTGNVAIFLNDGAGNFSDATLFATGKTPGVLRTGDVSGDGALDLVTIVSGNKLAVLKGNGDGTFGTAATLATGSVKPRDFALADLDNDNDLDLAVLHTGGQLATLGNDGTATFAAPTIAKTGAGATALAIADFNGDGNLDAAVTHSVTSRFIAVMLGKGDLAFLDRLKIAYPLGAKASALVASDFDGDGRIDLAIANGAGGQVRILRGLGNGGFAPTLNLTLDDTPPRKLSALTLGDFDGDGRADLLALSSATGEVSLVTRA